MLVTVICVLGATVSASIAIFVTRLYRASSTATVRRVAAAPEERLTTMVRLWRAQRASYAVAAGVAAAAYRAIDPGQQQRQHGPQPARRHPDVLARVIPD